MYTDIYKDHYIEANKTLQKIYYCSLIIAFTCLFVSVKAIYGENEASVLTVTIPFFNQPVDKVAGSYILLSMYIASGVLMLIKALKALDAFKGFNDKPDLIHAISTNPSLFVCRSPLKLILVLLPCSLLTYAFFIGSSANLTVCIVAATVCSVFHFLSAIVPSSTRQSPIAEMISN